MADVALYLRLSKADGDLGKDSKDESYSIENQRKLLKDYLQSSGELQGTVKEYIDAPDIIGLKQNPTKRASL